MPDENPDTPPDASPILADIPGLGPIAEDSGFHALEVCSDGKFRVGAEGVVSITSTGDRAVEFIAFETRTLAYVKSRMGYPAYYPVHATRLERPVKAVLMDLDGTSVRSEDFWIWIIERTTASLLGDETFAFEEADLPHVSGHSVSEHLQHAIGKYCPGATVEEARRLYFEHTRRELREIVEGRGRTDAFTPVPGLKPFLLELKSMGIKIGLVTSGLHEKAWPEIVSAFTQLDLGAPEEFYDAIVTAGFALGQGAAGTLGELSPKPHPWLYAEVARVGLGLDCADRAHIIGLEDSGAGVASVRLAGFTTVGIAGGNIAGSGTAALCDHTVENFEQLLTIIRGA